MSANPIVTERLELVRTTGPLLRTAAANDRAAMSKILQAVVPEDWPPQSVDDAFAVIADQLEAGPDPGIWSFWFVVQQEPRVLIGTFGFKGPPEDGQIDLGYAIVDSHQRRGYATEVTRRMLEVAFSHAAVRRAVGETFEELTASIRVMEKCGFSRCAEGVTGFSGEENVVRYELPRERWEKTLGR